MIKVVENLNVTKEEFFNALMNSFCLEYEQATNKELKIDQIEKGLKYSTSFTTQLKKDKGVEILVREYKFGEVYRYEVTTNAESYLVEYSAETIENDKTKVTYLRGYETEFKSRKYNQKFMELFYRGRAKRTVKIKLKMIEKYILQNR